jgi:hypothetical protein
VDEVFKGLNETMPFGGGTNRELRGKRFRDLEFKAGKRWELAKLSQESEVL